VSISVDVDQDVFQYCTSSVLDSADCGTQLDHGVLAVGYVAADGKGYWIVKNSWGPSWDDQGYLKRQSFW
jgi:C1A family cysteine protease